MHGLFLTFFVLMGFIGGALTMDIFHSQIPWYVERLPTNMALLIEEPEFDHLFGSQQKFIKDYERAGIRAYPAVQEELCTYVKCILIDRDVRTPRSHLRQKE